MDNNLRNSLLFDFYSPLLTDKQREIYMLSHEEDLSLAEIGEIYSISRQAVHDIIKRTDNILANYEEKLKMMNTFNELSKKIKEVRNIIDREEKSPVMESIVVLLDDLESLERK